MPPAPQILPVPNPVPSYWLTPPSKHARLRSTSTLPQSCTISIIGSGMAGVLTVYHLLQSANPPSILLLEARDLCSGATARNGGHVKIKTATLAGLSGNSERNALQTYVRRVMSDLARIVESEGMGDECEFELRKSWDVFLDEEEFERIKGVYDDAKGKEEAWTGHVRCVGSDNAARETSIKDAVGAFESEIASLWPYRFVTGLVDRMLVRYPERLNVQTNTPVTHMEEIAQGTLLTTPRGTLTTEKVVFATNAWTAGLLDAFKDTITPVKGIACHIRPSRHVDVHLSNTYNIHFAPASSTGVDYLNPRPDGGIVVGGGAWFFKAHEALWKGNFDDSVRFAAGVERHWTGEYMQKTFQGWEDSAASPDCIWTGIMGVTRDGKAHIGRVPGRTKKQHWMLAGFNGGGMSLIATASRAVAKMVVEDLEYEDVSAEFGLIEGWGTDVERMEEDTS
ncbi:hypothetical protein HBI95_244630 [Parastagonospora nodorum]|nr:hypothetical protein HBI95_244630 [Parastagonospora nodorum]